jgi:hypothetical protein
MTVSPEGGMWAMLGASQACAGLLSRWKMCREWGRRVRKDFRSADGDWWPWDSRSGSCRIWFYWKETQRLVTFGWERTLVFGFSNSFLLVPWEFHLCFPPQDLCSWLSSFFACVQSLAGRLRPRHLPEVSLAVQLEASLLYPADL